MVPDLARPAVLAREDSNALSISMLWPPAGTENTDERRAGEFAGRMRDILATSAANSTAQVLSILHGRRRGSTLSP
jgi:hypothetical protein